MKVLAVGMLAMALCGSGAAAQEPAPPPDSPRTITRDMLPHSDIPGASDPTFRAALASWLNGEDAQALPALAELANLDNLAAQLMLGVIKRDMWWSNPWALNLSRDEFNAIFRRDNPGGFPRWRYWGWIAADRLRLADLLLHSTPFVDGLAANGPTADLALELAALGESRATLTHLSTLLTQGAWQEAMRLEEVAAAYGAEGWVWAAATGVNEPGPVAQAMRARGIAEFRAGTTQGWLFASKARRWDLELNELIAPHDGIVRYLMRHRWPGLDTDLAPVPEGGPARLDALLAEMPEAVVPRRYCARACPDAVAVCTREMYGLVGGYIALIYSMASPVETLIPQELFLRSRRAEMLLEYGALLSTHPYEPDPGARLDALEIEACLTDALRPVLAGMIPAPDDPDSR